MAKSGQKRKGPPKSAPGKTFNEEALSQLTSRLDKSLGAGAAAGAGGEGGQAQKRKTPPATTNGNQQNEKRQRKSAQKPTKENGGKLDDSALLAEIKALGGDEKDLELIQGIDSSDDEFTQDQKQAKPIDKGLKEELAALSKQLGFANRVPEEASEDDQSDGDNGQDEDEDEEDIDADSEDDFDDEPTSDNEDSGKRKIGGLTFEPRADWHACRLGKMATPKSDQTAPYNGAIEALKEHAQALLDEDAAKYRTSVFASSSHKFLSTIMASGTLTDKVSALTLAVQESPIHNVRAFDALMNLASKKSRAQAIGALGALVDLLGPGTLLPPDRRLRTFHTQPGLVGALQRGSIKSWNSSQPLPSGVTKIQLMYWVFEDWLKSTYFKIIQLLEVWCSDEIEYSRSKSLDFVYALLKEKPEQEANLLRLLVNKLGDRDRKIASRASYLLLQLQNSHPGMKPIIVGTMEQEILLHPTQDYRSKYYTINTLNQTILSMKEPAVAEALVRMYFDLFVTLLKSGKLGAASIGTEEMKKTDQPQSKGSRPKRGDRKPKPAAPEPETESADKLVSAVLTGVNRAAPFVDASGTIMEKHLDTLFKIAHSANFNTGIQALLLIQHLSSTKNLANDRFYRVLYESLLDPRLVTSSKQALYLNLLLRSLKNDVDVRRVKAFAKRMLQTAHLHQPPFVCGLLYVVSHLRETFPDLSTLIEEPEESIFDDEPAEDRPAYDGRKRDPEYSNAHRSCLWEMIPSQAHFHPSVTVLASTLLKRGAKMQKPDMESHSLIRFLDKFVYRNAKSTDTSRGVSIMQPMRATKDVGDIWLGSRGAGTAATTSVNSSAFWNKKAEDVAAEDAFFHEYFQHASKEPKIRKTAAASGGDGDEDDNEDEIWQALVSAQPDVEDAGSDEGFDDLNESDMASDADSSPALSLDDDDDEDDDLELESADEMVEGDDELVQVDDADEDDTAAEKEKKEKKARRKALKDLPTFASADDYAELLGGDDDEDI